MKDLNFTPVIPHNTDALEHGIHMQEVIDIALRNYLNSNELPKYRSTEV